MGVTFEQARAVVVRIATQVHCVVLMAKRLVPAEREGDQVVLVVIHLVLAE